MKGERNYEKNAPDSVDFTDSNHPCNYNYNDILYVSGFESEKVTRRSVEGLNSAAPFIQGVVGKKIQTRLTPKLTFVYDDSIKEGFEINKKIEEILS